MFKLDHWFDGFTHVHRFQLFATADGSCNVTYNSRSQVDDLIERIRETGRLDGFTFAQKRDPCMSLFQKLKTVFESSYVPADYGDSKANIGATISRHFPSETGRFISENVDEKRHRNDRPSTLVVRTDRFFDIRP